MSKLVAVAWGETAGDLYEQYRAERDVEWRKRLGALWRVRAPPGVKVVQCLQWTYEWASLLMAVDPRAGTLRWRWLERCRAGPIKATLAARPPDPVVWDGHGARRARLLTDLPVRRVAPPPYSPDLDPAKRVIQEVRLRDEAPDALADVDHRSGSPGRRVLQDAVHTAMLKPTDQSVLLEVQVPARQDRSAVRQERILDAALDAFAERGYQDTTVDEIAGSARTSKGGIYFHFPGKDVIFLALLDRSANRLLARLTERVDVQPGPIAKVDAALFVLVTTFGSHRALARLFLVEALGAGPRFHVRLFDIQARFVAFLKRQLDVAVDQGLIRPLDTEVASLAWFGALNQVVTIWIMAGQPKRLEDAYPSLRTLLLQSLGLPFSASLDSGLPTGADRA